MANPEAQYDTSYEIDGFSEEEREDIKRQIDEAAQTNTIGTGTAFSHFNPRKKGAFFPLIVNIIALLCIGAGVFVANEYFNRRVEQLSGEAGALASAEGKILEEVRREAERRLREKDQEISEIQENLSQIESERQLLQETMEERLAQKEQELREQLSQALAAERSRLEAQGVAEGDLESRLQEFQSSKEREYQEDLASFQREIETQLLEKEEELTAARETAERILAEATEERQELINQANRREEELRRGFEQEREALTQETEQAQNELQRLEEIRRNEQLYMNRINSQYLEIQQALETEDPQEARGLLNELRSFIQETSVQASAEIARRRQVDSFLIGVLEERASRVGGRSESESLLEAARTMEAIRASVNEARARQEAGDLYEARRYYNQAIEMLPSLAVAVRELQSINRNEEADGITEVLDEARTNEADGEIEEALDGYAQAAMAAGAAHGALSREAVESLLRLEEQRRAVLGQEYSRQVDELEESLASTASEGEELRSQLSELNREYQERVESYNQEIENSRELLQQRESRIGELRQDLRQREAEIAELESELSDLEVRERRLLADYQRSQQRVASLNEDLEGAVDELTELVTLSESNRQLRMALERFNDFEQRSSELLSSPDAADTEAARSEFERFLSSPEIRSIFPGLAEMYRRLQ
ncbi:MAG TPA: hypothetical protein ENN41_08250 [Sediminispirochaeta sp.]|nr:hypothetical protein [Sediminispirochaeta sp.]